MSLLPTCTCPRPTIGPSSLFLHHHWWRTIEFSFGKLAAVFFVVVSISSSSQAKNSVYLSLLLRNEHTKTMVLEAKKKKNKHRQRRGRETSPVPTTRIYPGKKRIGNPYSKEWLEWSGFGSLFFGALAERKKGHSRQDFIHGYFHLHHSPLNDRPTFRLRTRRRRAGWEE